MEKEEDRTAEAATASTGVITPPPDAESRSVSRRGRVLLANFAEKIVPKSLASIMSPKKGAVIPLDPNDPNVKAKEKVPGILDDPRVKVVVEMLTPVVDMLTPRKKEVDKIKQDLAVFQQLSEDQVTTFSVAEKALLLRVEKSLLEQLALKNSVNAKEKEIVGLKRDVAGMKLDADNLKQTNTQTIDKLKADMKKFQQDRCTEQQSTQALTYSMQAAQTKLKELEMDSQACRRTIDNLQSSQRQSTSKALEETKQMNANLQSCREREEEASAGLKKLQKEFSEMSSKKDAELKAKTTATATIQSQLTSANNIVKDLQRDKDCLTSEHTSVSATLETIESELETMTKKYTKLQKEGKVVMSERDNFSLQLKGCQKELQALNLVVADIKQKELWASMEGGLQATSNASKADEIDGLNRELKACQDELKALKAK